jgi:hypothetical protein
MTHTTVAIMNMARNTPAIVARTINVVMTVSISVWRKITG